MALKCLLLFLVFLYTSTIHAQTTCTVEVTRITQPSTFGFLTAYKSCTCAASTICKTLSSSTSSTSSITTTTSRVSSTTTSSSTTTTGLGALASPTCGNLSPAANAAVVFTNYYCGRYITENPTNDGNGGIAANLRTTTFSSTTYPRACQAAQACVDYAYTMLVQWKSIELYLQPVNAYWRCNAKLMNDRTPKMTVADTNTTESYVWSQ